MMKLSVEVRICGEIVDEIDYKNKEELKLSQDNIFLLPSQPNNRTFSFSLFHPKSFKSNTPFMKTSSLNID